MKKVRDNEHIKRTLKDYNYAFKLGIAEEI